MKALTLITNPCDPCSVLLPFSHMQWTTWLNNGKKIHCDYCFLLIFLTWALLPES